MVAPSLEPSENDERPASYGENVAVTSMEKEGLVQWYIENGTTAIAFEGERWDELHKIMIL